MRRLIALISLAAALTAAPAVAAAANPQIAGLQVALRAHGLYLAQIDGLSGPKTAAAIDAFEAKHGLPRGPANARVRAALGPLGRPLFGSRTLRPGDFGWDVSVLQFLLTRRGVYTGALDGYLGKETAAALRHYQRLLHLSTDAVMGPRTLSAIVRKDRVPVRVRPASVPSSVHVVRVGDTLTALAARYGTTVPALAAVNHIDPARPIVIGQRLRLPISTRSLEAPKVDVRSMLDAWSSRLGVDPHLVRALAWMESGFQTHLVSDAGARGDPADAAVDPSLRRERAGRARDPAHGRRRHRGRGALPAVICCRSSAATSSWRWPAGTRASAPSRATGRTR